MNLRLVYQNPKLPKRSTNCERSTGGFPGFSQERRLLEMFDQLQRLEHTDPVAFQAVAAFITENASMTVVHRESGVVAYGYNVDKGNVARGMQSVAEACAKHLGNHIAGKE